MLDGVNALMQMTSEMCLSDQLLEKETAAALKLVQRQTAHFLFYKSKVLSNIVGPITIICLFLLPTAFA